MSIHSFYIFILITRLLKSSFSYFRALKTFQCHLLKVKFAASKSPQLPKTIFFQKAVKAAICLHSWKLYEMYWRINEIM